MKFKPIVHSWIAQHPEPKGVVEFLGGAIFGTLPNVCYGHFLHSLYDAGYTIITLPFRFGLNHVAIAEDLLSERDAVLQQLGESHQGIPRFWVGHSLGCKYIILLSRSAPKNQTV
jgi:predicted alpha/beta hydrolase